MPINLLSAGGGTTTLTTASSASNFTVTIPSGTGNALLDSTTGVCRAWVNFNGTGTVAIRASFNVSSITDNGTGDYTVNFTTAMPDVDYAVVYGPTIRAGGDANSIPRFYSAGTAATTSSYRALNNEISASRIAADTEFFYIAFFR
jgi:hypothetical protein